MDCDYYNTNYDAGGEKTVLSKIHQQDYKSINWNDNEQPSWVVIDIDEE